MSTPTVVLVPGSFAHPGFYKDNIIAGIEAKDIPIEAVHNLSSGLSAGQGRPGAPPSMYDDAAQIAEVVEKLADEGKDVVIVGHSYGGVPTTQSVKGLSKADRQKEGKKGGVVRLAYMTCLVPEHGATAASVLSGAPPEQTIKMNVGEDGWMYHDDPEASAKIVLNNLADLEEAVGWIKQMPKHSAVSFGDALTYEGFKDVPVSYLFCEEDLCIPPEVQQAGIDMIEKRSGRKVDVTEVKADHCCNISAPKETVDWLVSVVEKSAAGQ